MYFPLHSLLWVFAVSGFDYSGMANQPRDDWVESHQPRSEDPSPTQEWTPVIETYANEYVGGTLGPSDEHPDEVTTRGVRRHSFETGATNPRCRVLWERLWHVYTRQTREATNGPTINEA